MKRRLFLGILMVVCIFATMVIIVGAAYFAKGEFKDVFVNKKDNFSANVLYNITSIDAEKHAVGSSGSQRNIMIYNYDMSTGDFNSFDVEFDVYAWLDKPLPEGKMYVISDGRGNHASIVSSDHTEPVFRDFVLAGGQLSTATLTVDFNVQEGDDLTDAPGLYVVAVPTAPKRLTTFLLGALILPTISDAFDVRSSFDDTGFVKDYAAFKYTVKTAGIAPTGNKIRIKWRSDALILMRVNGEDPETSATVQIQQGDFGDGFDRMVELDAQSDHMDYFVFFRNSENAMWETEDQTWEQLYEQVSMEYVKNP